MSEASRAKAAFYLKTKVKAKVAQVALTVISGFEVGGSPHLLHQKQPPSDFGLKPLKHESK
jgi:hypothetical protein